MISREHREAPHFCSSFGLGLNARLRFDAASCLKHSTGGDGPEYLNLLDAVFRYQVAGWEEGHVDYIFLELDQRDPPVELFEWFKGRRPPVLPASMADASIDGVRHKHLGGHGLILNITRIAWLGPDAAEVTGGSYQSGLAASTHGYRVERRRGKWVVIRDELQGIS